MPDLRGGCVVALTPSTLQWATEQMVNALGRDALRKLKVRSGEHLAAILTTAFLNSAPIAIDAAGGPDLSFELSYNLKISPKIRSMLGHGAHSVAFEVNSMPGPSRKFNSEIERDMAQGNHANDHSLEIRTETASEALSKLGPVLRTAAEQLCRKTRAETSRNIFIVIHLFDHFVTECTGPILGPALDPLPDIEGVDTVWVLWPFEHLTVWSSEQRSWIDLIFGTPVRAADRRMVAPTGKPESDEFGPIQYAEDYFLTRIGHYKGSPYLFRISLDPDDRDDKDGE